MLSYHIFSKNTEFYLNQGVTEKIAELIASKYLERNWGATVA